LRVEIADDLDTVPDVAHRAEVSRDLRRVFANPVALEHIVETLGDASGQHGFVWFAANGRPFDRGAHLLVDDGAGEVFQVLEGPRSEREYGIDDRAVVRVVCGSKGDDAQHGVDCGVEQDWVKRRGSSSPRPQRC